MMRFSELLEETLSIARARQWAAYRLSFARLHEALDGQLDASEEDLRMRLDMLNGAAPEHDPEGYLVELECLAELLRGRGGPEPEVREGPAPLDLRGLQPPEPIVRIFEVLERAPREPLRVILPHEPVPLYGLLRERGFSWSGSPRPDGSYELLIEAS